MTSDSRSSSIDGQAMPRVRVQLAEGMVEGVIDRGLSRFRGIPFARAPFGDLRFRYPEPVERWDGVRDAADFGVGAMQPVFSDDPTDKYFNPRRQGQDCLNLDVWTPDPGTSGLPVMVWIHGGGFMTGTGSAPAHDGYTFARDGIVHVGINYRLGIEGFVYLGEGTDNLGLRDQVAALEWVQRNIARFGGDPDNVTIFGQSAGAISVLDLMAMPSARGLFAKAIVQSGAPHASVSIDDALEVTAKTAELLGVEATREAFSATEPDAVVAATLPMALDFVNPRRWGKRSFLVSPYRAVHGTPSLPESPLACAGSSEIPLLTGTTRNETTGFLQALGGLGRMNPLVGRRLLAYLGAGRSVRKAYRTSRQGMDTLRMVEAAWTDWAFRIPTIELLERRTADSFLYEFQWESPGLPAGLGSNHALELPFVREDFKTVLRLGEAGQDMLGDHAPAALATRMHEAWCGFARTGDPGWPVYDATHRTTMIFNTSSSITDDPAGIERRAWAALR